MLLRSIGLDTNSICLNLGNTHTKDIVVLCRCILEESRAALHCCKPTSCALQDSFDGETLFSLSKIDPIHGDCCDDAQELFIDEIHRLWLVWHSKCGCGWRELMSSYLSAVSGCPVPIPPHPKSVTLVLVLAASQFSRAFSRFLLCFYALFFWHHVFQSSSTLYIRLHVSTVGMLCCFLSCRRALARLSLRSALLSELSALHVLVTLVSRAAVSVDEASDLFIVSCELLSRSRKAVATSYSC